MRQHSDNAHTLARETNEPVYIRSIDWERHGIYAGRSENPTRTIRKMAIVKRSTGKSARIADVRKSMGTAIPADTSAPKAKKVTK